MYFSTQLENVYNAHENFMRGCELNFAPGWKELLEKQKCLMRKFLVECNLKPRLKIAPLSIVMVMPHKIIKNYDAARGG